MKKITTNSILASKYLVQLSHNLGIVPDTYMIQTILFGLYGVYLSNTNEKLFPNEQPYLFSGIIIFPNSFKIFNNIVKPLILPGELKLDISYNVLNNYNIHDFLINDDIADFVYSTMECLSEELKPNEKLSDQLIHRLFQPMKMTLKEK